MAEQDEETRAFFELVASGENLVTEADVTATFDAPVEDYGEHVADSEALDRTVVVRRR